MNTTRIHEIIQECCCAYRKGAVVTERQLGTSALVVNIDLMPPVSDVPVELRAIDVHFFVVGVDRQKASLRRRELSDLLCEWPAGRLAQGPSYIESGGVLGSQEAALCLYGLGAALGFWGVVTPATVGVSGDKADALAEGGFVMCSGFEPARDTPP